MTPLAVVASWWDLFWLIVVVTCALLVLILAIQIGVEDAIEKYFKLKGPR